MEFLDSGELASFLKKNPGMLNKLLCDVLSGLSYLHSKGIIHRDLKPQNILIKTENGAPVAKITDFGISKALNSDQTNASALVGTIEYMAPEQFNPQKYGIQGRIGTNIDIWSFGIMLYELLTGDSLFGSRLGGTTAQQLMSNILTDIPMDKLGRLAQPYREVVEKCLVKDANLRVKDAAELIPLLQGNITVPAVHFNQPGTSPGVVSSSGQAPSNAETMVIPPSGQAPSNAETMVIPGHRAPSSTQAPSNTTPSNPTGTTQPSSTKKKGPALMIGLAAFVLVAVVGLVFLLKSAAEPDSNPTPKSNIDLRDLLQDFEERASEEQFYGDSTQVLSNTDVVELDASDLRKLENELHQIESLGQELSAKVDEANSMIANEEMGGTYFEDLINEIDNIYNGIYNHYETIRDVCRGSFSPGSESDANCKRAHTIGNECFDTYNSFKQYYESEINN